VGHATPNNTQLNYIQDAFDKNLRIPITDEQLSILIGWSKTKIRKHRSIHFNGHSVVHVNALLLKRTIMVLLCKKLN
jgi:hypothetical protein